MTTPEAPSNVLRQPVIKSTKPERTPLPPVVAKRSSPENPPPPIAAATEVSDPPLVKNPPDQPVKNLPEVPPPAKNLPEIPDIDEFAAILCAEEAEKKAQQKAERRRKRIERASAPEENIYKKVYSTSRRSRERSAPDTGSPAHQQQRKVSNKNAVFDLICDIPGKLFSVIRVSQSVKRLRSQN